MRDFRLYVWIRSDLASMTPGKACAQVAHAASQAAWLIYRSSEAENQLSTHMYNVWEDSAQSDPKVAYSEYTKSCFQGFGTTIVLDGGDYDTMHSLMYDTFDTIKQDICCMTGAVVDPGYPIKDGKYTHQIEALTCVWLFADASDPKIKEYTKGWPLYNGQDL